MGRWLGHDPKQDDFGKPIVDVFYDAKTKYGPWAILSQESFDRHCPGKLGVGHGQKYQKTPEGWMKVSNGGQG